MLHRIPSREELTVDNGQTFAATPRTCEVEFPFGRVQSSVPPSSDDEEQDQPPKRARVNEPDGSEPGSLKIPIKKFNPFAANNMVKALSLHKKIVIPENMLDHHWENKYLELSSLAVTSSTWKCHLSSFNKLKSFAKSTNTKINWPLNEKIRNGFIVWCFDKGNVNAKTVDKYLVHLNSIQSFLGFKKFNKNRDQTKTLLKGYENARFYHNKKPKTRKAITFHLLQELKNKTRSFFSNKLISKTFWCICSLAFFGCFRLGEILTKNKNSFDPASDLLWKDVKIHRKSISINIKTQKVTSGYPNKIYLFNFKNKHLCPVRSIKSLKHAQSKINLFNPDWPVFRTGKTAFVAQKDINRFLKNSFPNSNISGHSFRAGIPTSIANFPDLTNDNHAMGWGRWRSKAFASYQKSKKKQKKWVFRKIEKALLS